MHDCSRVKGFGTFEGCSGGGLAVDAPLSDAVRRELQPSHLGQAGTKRVPRLRSGLRWTKLKHATNDSKRPPKWARLKRRSEYRTRLEL